MRFLRKNCGNFRISYVKIADQNWGNLTLEMARRDTERTLSAWRRFAPTVHVWGFIFDGLFFIPFQKACFCRVLPTVLNVTVFNPVFDTVPVLSLCFSVRDLFPNAKIDNVY